MSNKTSRTSNTSKIGRDARTGHFTTVKQAQRQSSTHVVETIRHPKGGKK